MAPTPQGWNYENRFVQIYTADEKLKIGKQLRQLMDESQEKDMLDHMFAMHEIHNVHMSLNTYQECNKKCNWGLELLRNSRVHEDCPPAVWTTIEPTFIQCQSKGLTCLQTAFLIFERHKFKADQAFYSDRSREDKKKSKILNSGLERPSSHRSSDSRRSPESRSLLQLHAKHRPISTFEFDIDDRETVFVDSQDVGDTEIFLDLAMHGHKDQVNFTNLLRDDQKVTSMGYDPVSGLSDGAAYASNLTKSNLGGSMLQGLDNHGRTSLACGCDQKEFHEDQHGDAFELEACLIEVSSQFRTSATEISYPESHILPQTLVHINEKMKIFNLECLIRDFLTRIEHDMQRSQDRSDSGRSSMLEISSLPWRFYSDSYNGFRDATSEDLHDRPSGQRLLNQARSTASKAFAHPTKRLIPCVFLYYFLACEGIEENVHQAFTRSLWHCARDSQAMGPWHPLTQILDILAGTGSISAPSKLELSSCIVENLHDTWDTDFDAVYEARELFVKMSIGQQSFREAHNCCDEMIQRLTKQPNADSAYIRRARRLKGRTFFEQGDILNAKIVCESLLLAWEIDGMPPTMSKEWMVHELLAQLERTQGRIEVAEVYRKEAIALSDRSYKGGANSRRVAREWRILSEAMGGMTFAETLV